MRNINNSDNRINVDSRNYSTIARFRQEDDATLVVNLYKNGSEFDVSNQTVTLRALRADNQCINQTDNISKNKNIVTINFRRNILSVVGRTSIQLNISDSAGQFTTAEFFIEVEKNNLGADVLKGSDNVQALQQILIDFKKEKSSLIKNITDDYNSLKKIIISQNQAADLQNQINRNKQQSVENTNRIEQLEDLTPVWQEHEGTGSVAVNDSFDGIAKDLIIRGRTLKNLLSKEKFINTGKLEKTTQSGRECYKILEFSWWNNENNYKIDGVFKENTAYTLIYDFYQEQAENPGIYFRVEYTDGTGESLSAKEYGKWISKTFVTSKSKTIKCIKLTYWLASTVTYFDVNSFRLLEGDYTNKPIPSTYFDSITSSGEQEDNKIKIKSTGKNLFNEQFEQGRWYYATGNKLTKVTSPTGFICANPIKILPNTKYITDFKNNGTSGYFILADSQMIITRAINFGVMNNSKTIVTTNEEHYLAFYSVDESTRGYEITQIEEGSIATNYEQYRAKLIEIPLPFQKGLKSTLDGSVFDEINGNTGEIIQRVSDEYTALAKPIIHKIDNIQLDTFDTTTHITQENNILSDINFKAKVSLSSQAKRLTEENKALKEENRELREDTNTIVDSLISFFGPMLLPADDDVGGDQKILEKLYQIKNR